MASLQSFTETRDANRPDATLFGRMTLSFSIGFRWLVGRLKGRSNECRSVALSPAPIFISCARAAELIRRKKLLQNCCKAVQRPQYYCDQLLKELKKTPLTYFYDFLINRSYHNPPTIYLSRLIFKNDIF